MTNKKKILQYFFSYFHRSLHVVHHHLILLMLVNNYMLLWLFGVLYVIQEMNPIKLKEKKNPGVIFISENTTCSISLCFLRRLYKDVLHHFLSYYSIQSIQSCKLSFSFFLYYHLQPVHRHSWSVLLIFFHQKKIYVQ
jgi:hypothetical protein